MFINWIIDNILMPTVIGFMFFISVMSILYVFYKEE